jgi:hypothetical protein
MRRGHPQGAAPAAVLPGIAFGAREVPVAHRPIGGPSLLLTLEPKTYVGA